MSTNQPRQPIIMPMIHGWRRCRFHACQQPSTISTEITRMPIAPRTVLLSGAVDVCGASEEPLLVSAFSPWTMPSTVGLK